MPRKLKTKKNSKDDHHEIEMETDAEAIARRKQMMVGAVEEQIKSQDTPYVSEIYNQIIEKGFSEIEAKEKIAVKLIEEMYFVMSKKELFNEERYKSALKTLL